MSTGPWQTPDPIKAAQAFRGNEPVPPLSDTTIIAEAEEFQPQAKSAWLAQEWGKNYYCATFANAFLSRKAFLALRSNANAVSPPSP